MNDRPREPLWVRSLPWLLAAGLALFANFHISVGTMLADPFHEGEYVATRLLFAPGLGPPLLIHGYMDYLPARLAEALFGADHLIAGTRLISMLIGALASFALLGCMMQIARNRAETLGTLLIGGALLLIYNVRLDDMLALLQGSPAVRDVALLFEIWCLLIASGRDDRRADLFAGLAGLIAGLGFFWAYNRGVMGLAGLGAFCAATLLTGRRRRHALWPAVGALVGMLLCFAAEPAIWPRHIANILYWQQHGAIWHQQLNKWEWAHYLPFFLAGAAILLVGVMAIWRSRHDPDRRTLIPRLAMLLIIAAIGWQGAFNRADNPHLNFAVPWLGLLALAAWGALTEHPGPLSWREALRARLPLLAVVAGLLVLDLSPGDNSSWPAAMGFETNVVTVARGLPRDRDIVEPRLLAAADRLRAGGGRCTYVFDNSGALYHLAGLPPCSSVMLPIYAAGSKEDQVIADLTAARPPLVVGRSDEWNDHIDERGLTDRTPKLSRWLANHYRRESIVDGIEIWRILPDA